MLSSVCRLTAHLCLCIRELLIEFVSVPLMLSQQIKRELLESQQKVSSLQELSAQLLVTTSPLAPLLQTQRSGQSRAQGSECLEAQEKVHVIMNRLKLLLKQVTSDLQGLETRLEASDRQQVGKRQHMTSPGFAATFKLNDTSVYSPGVLIACRQSRTLSLSQSDVRGDWAQSQTIGNVFNLITCRGHPLHIEVSFSYS